MSARVNEWVSEYVIRWPICFSAVRNVLTDLVWSGTVWFGLDRRLLSQAKSLYQSESHFSFYTCISVTPFSCMYFVCWFDLILYLPSTIFQLNGASWLS